MNSIMDILYVPMGYILNFCYQILPNYALALLVFTLLAYGPEAPADGDRAGEEPAPAAV